MFQTIVKGGVITQVVDSCPTLEHAITEQLAEARNARGLYFNGCWHKLGYNQIDRDDVIRGVADATTTTDYTKLLAKANTEFNKVYTAVSNSTTNAEVYSHVFQLEVPENITRADLDNNGIIDWLENLVV